MPRLSKRINREERRQTFEKAHQTRLPPVELDVRDKSGYEDQIDRAITVDLKGDADVAIAGIVRLGDFRCCPGSRLDTGSA